MPRTTPSRRDFLKSSAVGAAVIGAQTIGSSVISQSLAAPAIVGRYNKPNLLMIIADQLGLDAIGAHGRQDVRTPNLDRLINTGTTFIESHSTNSVCSPARSSLMTGRMPQETGVMTNGVPIDRDCPTIGHVLGGQGYDSFYCGKWHCPGPVPGPGDGFTVLPARGGQGDIDDTAISRTVEGLIRNRSRADGSAPWLTVASFLQPHDICFWGNHVTGRIPEGLPFDEIKDQLPPLPPNNRVLPKSPKCLIDAAKDRTDLQWQYYLYIYARMIEMLDSDVGRLLNALDESGQADNTVIAFTSDHGDGQGRHELVSKWYPYEEAVKVPLVFTCPELLPSGVADRTNLVTGCDIMPTFCSLADVKAPERLQGIDLLPVLEQQADAKGHDAVVSCFRNQGLMLRTEQYKFAMVPGDPVEQLFDMKADPWETVNLCDEKPEIMAEHRKLLDEKISQLQPVDPPPKPAAPRPRPQKKPTAKNAA